jgi:hypothetical protein
MANNDAKNLALFIEICKQEARLLAIPINNKQTGLTGNWGCFPFNAGLLHEYFTKFPANSHRAFKIHSAYIKVHNQRLYIKLPNDPYEFAIDENLSVTWNQLYLIWLEMRINNG